MTYQLRTTLANVLVALLILGICAACAAEPASPTPFPTDTPQPTDTPRPTPEPTPTEPPTITVCSDGCDFTTIQAAIDAAQAGDVIGVADAVHTEASITVNKDLTIQGVGAENTIVQAADTPEDAPDRVFLIEQGATVTIAGMTIRHGYPPVCPQSGGGIANHGTLTLQHSAVIDNRASAGGGIMNDGTLVVINSTISDNTADGSGNHGRGRGSGGGIKSTMGELIILNSTISGNSSTWHGGGMHIACNCTATISNSTISGNQAAHNGGGVNVRGATEIVNCTISGNNASGGGGGVYANGALDFANNIIAGNVAGNADYGSTNDCAPGDDGQIGTNSHNLIEDGSCDAAYSGDPMLDTLADNGGPTRTHALLPGSPAVDALPADACALTTDQRGMPRPVMHTSGDTPCDIGAFELQPGEASSIYGPRMGGLEALMWLLLWAG